MPKVTNLQAIKNIAATLINLDFEKTAFYPMVIQHPYTTSTLVGLHTENGSTIVNLLEDKASLAKWQDMLKNEINCAQSVSDIYCHLTKPYVLSFLQLIEKHLSSEDLSEILRDTWMNIEFVSSNPVFTKAEFTKLFRKCDPSALMTPDERDELAQLPDPITIYRGIRKDSKKIKGMSWTTDPAVAEWFSHRFSSENTKGDIYQATIPKSDVLAYFKARREEEIVVDTRRLCNIKKLSPKAIENLKAKASLEQVISDATLMKETIISVGKQNRKGHTMDETFVK